MLIKRCIVYQIVKLRPFVYIAGNFIFHGNGTNGDHTAIAEFQLYTAVIHVVGAGKKSFHKGLPPKFDLWKYRKRGFWVWYL